MMIEVICRVTEYIGVMLCLHAFANAKREINVFNVILGVINVGVLSYIDRYSDKRTLVVMLLYFTIFLYVKVKLEQSWFNAVKIWGIMMVVIPSLQLGIYLIIKICLKTCMSDGVASIVTNILIGILFYLWNEKYFFVVVISIRKRIWFIISTIFLLTIIYVLILYIVKRVVLADVMIQMVGSIWGLLLLVVLFLTAEMEKKNKEKELRLYQVYNKSFEDAIITIRHRQHEFCNHINAIKSMQYTIDDTERLIEEQNKYCDLLLRDNELNSLLKRDLEPIVISVLYTKLLAAQNIGIEVSQTVHAIDFKKRIEIVELVEIIGILVDNAVEALMTEQQSEKKLRVRILLEEDKHFSIEVANACKVLLQSDIEKFTESGYSTKGTERGMGLARLKAIIKRNNAEISMGNTMYEGHNYFSVRVFI